jgi:hypothetical protein
MNKNVTTIHEVFYHLVGANCGPLTLSFKYQPANKEKKRSFTYDACYWSCNSNDGRSFVNQEDVWKDAVRKRTREIRQRE